MLNFLSEHYLLIKALHIISVIFWMAGLFYLPRLYVYHVGTTRGSELDLTLQIMERRLLRIIINPSMVATFIFGLLMVCSPAFNMGPWFHVKLLLVAFMVVTHGMAARYRKNFANGTNSKTATFYRVFNEVPTILCVIIVLLAVTKGF